MIRKIVFWSHLPAGVSAGFFIFVIAFTGIILSFEKPIVNFADRNVRAVTVPSDGHARSMNDLLEVVRRARLGNPTAIVATNQAQAATQFSFGRGKAVYVDPYSGAVLGISSPSAHNFFFKVEQLHRTLGAPLGSKSIGHWLAAVSNFLFGVLVLLGVILWMPRNWNGRAIRASIIFRSGLRGKARLWNWHNAIGVWCALPLIIIVFTGMVMSFDWANALLFQLAGSAPATSMRTGADRRMHDDNYYSAIGDEPNYDHLLKRAKTLNRDWRTITLNVARDANAAVSVTLDTGSGAQPQNRTQYLLDRDSGQVLKITRFADISLGQRLRAFVRFGHTGEYGGWLGQVLATTASFGACVLVYTGLSLTIRRFVASLKRRTRHPLASRQAYEDQPVG